MGKAYFNSKQNTAILSNLIVFTCFAKLATAWNCFIDRWKTLINNCPNELLYKLFESCWIQNFPFCCENFMYQHNLRWFYADKVSCNTNKATRSKTKKITFRLAAMKFCNSVLHATPAVPTQTFLSLRINTFVSRKNPFAFPPKEDFVACWFSFTFNLRGVYMIMAQLSFRGEMKSCIKPCLLGCESYSAVKLMKL